MILEYLKVILGTPVLIAATTLTFLRMFRSDVKALMARIAKVKFPGGEIEASQLQKLHEQPPINIKVPELTATQSNQVSEQPVAADGNSATSDTLTAVRSMALLWEFRYLNLFLARGTQIVLNWFARDPRATVALFHAIWLPQIPNSEEREAILIALHSNQLISIDNDLVTVTQKGRDYLEWRGPQLELQKTA
jgi:hypothetical protein